MSTVRSLLPGDNDDKVFNSIHFCSFYNYTSESIIHLTRCRILLSYSIKYITFWCWILFTDLVRCLFFFESNNRCWDKTIYLSWNLTWYLKIFICIVSQKQKERHEQEEKLYHYKKEKAEIEETLNTLRRKEHDINETIGKLNKDIERCETTKNKIKAQGKKKAFLMRN